MNQIETGISRYEEGDWKSDGPSATNFYSEQAGFMGNAVLHIVPIEVLFRTSWRIFMQFGGA